MADGRVRRAATIAAALGAIALAAAAPLPAQLPGSDATPAVRAVRTEDRIVLDGVPDEPAWLTADSVVDFRQQDPQEGAPVSERTVVRLLATPGGLAVAFWCYDREPGRIRRTQLRRDADTDPDDFVAILLDTQRDKRTGYAFAVNPNGALNDVEVLNFEDQNGDWNGVWDARARVTPWGWSAEMLLPWQMLRYRLGETQWGINLGRIVRRRNESAFWRGWRRQQGFFFEQEEATLVVPPDLPRRQPFEGRPYTAATHQADTRTFLASGVDSVTQPGGDSLKFGFDGKLAVAPTLNLDVTINTDFAQVEADQQVINLTRFPVFFPEKRDFFLESSGIFAFGNEGVAQLFHSRRIGLDTNGNVVPIIAGTRLTGRLGHERVGVLALRTGGDEDAFDAVGRIQHDILSRGYIGAMGTAQSGPGVPGTRLGGGADVSIPTLVGNGQNLNFRGFAMWSRDSAAGATAGSFYALADYPNDWSNDFISVMRVDSGFDPAFGFVRQDGIWRLNTLASFYPRPHRWGIRRFAFTALEAETIWRTSGGLDHASYSVQPFGVEFESGDGVNVTLGHNDDVPRDSFEVSNGVFVPPGKYGWNLIAAGVSSSVKRPLSGQLTVAAGGFYDGTSRSVSYQTSVRAAPHVVASVEGEVNRVRLSSGQFTAQVHRLRFDYASSPRLNTTLFLQWDNASDRLAVNARVHWIPRPGVDGYLVWNSTWFSGLSSGVPWDRPLHGALIGKFVYYFRV